MNQLSVPLVLFLEFRRVLHGSRLKHVLYAIFILAALIQSGAIIVWSTIAVSHMLLDNHLSFACILLVDDA